MASSYSTSLRLELQASGENRNTWGTKNNTNLSLLEASISGAESIDMSDANVTLTTNNGATDQARKMIINLTGTNTAARNLVIPTVSKVYIVRNATTGGFAVSVTNGSSSVSVTNGTVGIIFTVCTDSSVRVTVLRRSVGSSSRFADGPLAGAPIADDGKGSVGELAPSLQAVAVTIVRPAVRIRLVVLVISDALVPVGDFG